MFTDRIAYWLGRAPRHAKVASFVPRLENLENRLTPAVSANDLFVASLYQGLLGRSVEPAGLMSWTSALNRGLGRPQVAQSIAGSTEALGRDVQLFYQALLGREP